MTAALIQSGRLGLGYSLARENTAALQAQSRPFGVRATDPPAAIDHRSWLKAISQLNMGSCVGHGARNCAIVLNWIQTGGSVEDFSRMWFYLRAQAHSGFLGADQ